MPKPKILVLSGYGLNCEEETAVAFNLAGGDPTIVHINDLVASKKLLDQFQILAIPGGFSYGDDTGSGRAYANKLNNHFSDTLNKFAASDKLIIGICNGFQILTQVGLLPGALTFNDRPRYTDRWVDVAIQNNKSSIPPRNFLPLAQNSKAKNIWGPGNRSSRVLDPGSPKASAGMTANKSPWLTGIKSLSLPIAHGEGKFYADDKTLAIIKKQHQIAGTYFKGEICKNQNLPANPNGSTLDIAMLASANGKILGSMPHPERAMFFTQLPHWTLLKEKLLRAGKPLPKFGPGLEVFKNGVEYFK